MNISDILTSTIYSNGVATIAMIVACVAVPASGYLSYHYAIKGEKRKEWNLLAVPMREKLVAQIDAINRGEYANADITRADILKFYDMQGGKERSDLLIAFEEFENSHTFEELWEVAPGRKMVVGDTTNALSTSIKLLSLIPRK
ncbi:hypothetical protein GHT40_04520 [Citrobacter werkmanii]|uniref:hypothetical protein n=1 Tax=Citrobacter werkmanii TaxID=67827 RepID=UPI001901EFA7|nr:hypothetical protein [Citrobacter werkmanii]MBJ9293558.1 hypothetical protein [Citrobacter werkmanii]